MKEHYRKPDCSENLPIIVKPSNKYLSSSLESLLSEFKNFLISMKNRFCEMAVGNLEFKDGGIVHDLRCRISDVLEERGVIEVVDSGEVDILHPDDEFVRLLNCLEQLFVDRRIYIDSSFIRSGVVKSVCLEDGSLLPSVDDKNFPFGIVFRFDFYFTTVKWGILGESLCCSVPISLNMLKNVISFDEK